MSTYAQELALLHDGRAAVPGWDLDKHHSGTHLPNQQCKRCREEIREIAERRAPLELDIEEAQSSCPNCPKPVKPGRKYCSPTCALVFAAHKRRKIDPEILKVLHLEDWLPREETARRLGVTAGGINTALGRLGLFRKRCPSICRMKGCNEPTYFRLNSHGQKIGNKCKKHWLAYQARQRRDYYRRTHTLLTPAERSQKSAEAGRIRWEHNTAPTIADLVYDLLKARGPMRLKDIRVALSKPPSSLCNALKRRPEVFRSDRGTYSLILALEIELE